MIRILSLEETVRCWLADYLMESVLREKFKQKAKDYKYQLEDVEKVIVKIAKEIKNAEVVEK